MAVPGEGDTSRRAVHLLADVAIGLARRGATAETVFPDHLERVPGDLAAALAPLLAPPDRVTGTRVVSGLLAGFDPPGPTPARWGEPGTVATRALDIGILLAGSVIGQVFGWEGQQAGRLVHDIVPSKGVEDLQVGASSLTSLEWHTEDSFHPERATLLLLACVRNPDGVGSRVSSVRQAALSRAEIDVLRDRQVVIMPDDSYPSPDRGSTGTEPAIATLWDAADGMCVRYDPAYTRMLTPDPAFRAAYAALGDALEAGGRTVSVRPGDALLIDNDIAVHGRSAFEPRYDGTDRWLKRALIRLPRPRPTTERLEHGFGQRVVEPRGARR